MPIEQTFGDLTNDEALAALGIASATDPKLAAIAATSWGGNALKVLQVNATENGWQFAAITGYTDEAAQDAVGGILTDSATIDFTYSDATPSITADVKTGSVTLAMQANMATASVVYRKTAGAGAPEVQTLATLKTDLSLTGTNSGDQATIVGITGTKAQFDTACTDGNFLYAGDVVAFTDEAAQDAIGAMVDASLVYVDATPLLTRAALIGDATAAQGSNALTLATVNANVGTFGGIFAAPTYTVNAKGLITAASEQTWAALASATHLAATDEGLIDRGGTPLTCPFSLLAYRGSDGDFHIGPELSIEDDAGALKIKTDMTVFFMNAAGSLVWLTIDETGDCIFDRSLAVLENLTVLGNVTLGNNAADITQMRTAEVLNNFSVNGTSTLGNSAGDATTIRGTITASERTASELLATDASKNIVSLAVATYPSLTELAYVKGVTSGIQTQINALAAAGVSDGDKGDIVVSSSGTVWSIDAGVIVNADVNASAAIALSKLAATTASRALVSDGSGFVSAATTTATELGYVNGVTSAIQTQINGKQPIDSDLTTIAGLTATTDNFIVSVSSAWASRTPAQVRTTLDLAIGTSGNVVPKLNGALTTWAAGATFGGIVQGARLGAGTASPDGTIAAYREVLGGVAADTYAGEDQGVFNFYAAENAGGAAAYNRLLDIVAGIGGTNTSHIRFLTASNAAAPSLVATLDGYQLFIANTAGAPGSNPVGGGYLYVDGGALKFRGSSGTVTTIAPA